MAVNLNKNGDTRGKHVLVYAQKDIDIQEVSLGKGWYSARHTVVILLLFGMANAYIMRTNMSVAIVAMVNQTALPKDPIVKTDECPDDIYKNKTESSSRNEGEFVWTTTTQGWILSSFFFGYVMFQIPFGLLTKKYGAKYFLGVGMLINSVFGLLVPISAKQGIPYLILVRFIQGLGEGPIVPCTHAMLAKWIPPNERSRMGAIVYAGAQLGTVISMPLSGYLSEVEFANGWPSIFYVFGLVGLIWSILFLIYAYEDPESHPTISEDEKKYIINSVWGAAGVSSPPIPWKSLISSLPFWAILIAHMGQNYGYETLMTELPTFMKQVLHFNIKENGVLSAVPYLSMWILSIVISYLADWLMESGRISRTVTRKLANGLGQYGPAIALVAASYTGCNPYLTVFILSIGVGVNGGIYSGFKVNHLDISPRFAGILMGTTNCLGNLAGLVAPVVAGHIIHGQPTQAAWQKVFFISAAVYVVCNTFYQIFGSGVRQPWDNPENDKATTQKPQRDVEESQH